MLILWPGFIKLNVGISSLPFFFLHSINILFFKTFCLNNQCSTTMHAGSCFVVM